MVYGIISYLGTPTVIGVDSTLSAHVPLAHFLINHIIVIYFFTPSIYMAKLLARHLASLSIGRKVGYASQA